uniref:Uncharacterized protein n=1 Tax=Moniliophthora roreri TaxID=221103 RepID=A0A0W0GBI0_MONRR
MICPGMPTNVIFISLTSVESVFTSSIPFLKAANSVSCTLIEIDIWKQFFLFH